MAITEIFIYHEERGYFGETETFKSSVWKPSRERAEKAVDKFFIRFNDHKDDVMHIITEDKDYVLCNAFLDGEWQMCWFCWYGKQSSQSDKLKCKKSYVKRMLRSQYGEEA